MKVNLTFPGNPPKFSNPSDPPKKAEKGDDPFPPKLEKSPNGDPPVKADAPPKSPPKGDLPLLNEPDSNYPNGFYPPKNIENI